MVVKLNRFYSTNEVCLGEISIEDRHIAYSLELPFNNNKRNISSIPSGSYNLVKRWTKERGDHLMVENVPNRSSILIHSGNTVKDIQGCILLGDTISMTETQKSVLNSRKTIAKFNSIIFDAFLRGLEVTLVIQDVSKQIIYPNQI